MEQSSIAPERGGLTVQSISAVAKDIFVWIVGPLRSVNYFNLRRIEMILLTYLLTHVGVQRHIVLDGRPWLPRGRGDLRLNPQPLQHCQSCADTWQIQKKELGGLCTAIPLFVKLLWSLFSYVVLWHWFRRWCWKASIGRGGCSVWLQNTWNGDNITRTRHNRLYIHPSIHTRL